jgi:hypothetical protein
MGFMCIENYLVSNFEGAEEDIWTEEGRGDGRMEKIA